MTVSNPSAKTVVIQKMQERIVPVKTVTIWLIICVKNRFVRVNTARLPPVTNVVGMVKCVIGAMKVWSVVLMGFFEMVIIRVNSNVRVLTGL